MFSILVILAKKVFENFSSSNTPEFSSDLPNLELDVEQDLESKKEKDDEVLLDEIAEIRKDTVEKEEPQLNPDTEEPECIYADGIVTHVYYGYVLVDNKYTCKNRYIIPSKLKVEDRVHYMAYKTTCGQELKIQKIINVVSTSCEEPLESQESTNQSTFDATNDEEKNSQDESDKPTENGKEDNEEIVNKRQVSKRLVIGKVIKRKGREVYLEENNISFNLDAVKADFVPVIGDWLRLSCVFEINEEVPNFQGKMLEIKSMSALRLKKKIGKVTDYNNQMEYGIIDNTIIFSKLVCMAGYFPCIGDKVVVQSIESDQGLQQNWRALSLMPIKDLNIKHKIRAVEPKLSDEELSEMVKDKENLEITNDIQVTLDIEEEKEIKIVIKNFGNFTQFIKKCVFLSKKSESQLKLESPSNQEDVVVRPLGEVVYTFKCKAKFVGVFKELLYFQFGKFRIGRIIQITVNSINVEDSDHNKKNSESIVPQEFADGMYIKGVKPFEPAKSIPIRPVTWKIPTLLWATIDTILQEKKTRTESECILGEKIPCLNQPLSIQNYKQRFDYLLYLEEIAQILEMRKFNMDKAVMHHSGEYLTLSVPGIAEKRSSLVIGARVIVRYKFKKDSKLYEGYIHKIRSSDIFLKFSTLFHEEYKNEDCEVNFRLSTSVLQRYHAAVGAVINSLGQDFLFPTKVLQKEPQYNFIDEDDDDKEPKEEELKLSEMTEEDREKFIENMINKRKLEWFNKRLNQYQKRAVTNVLKGLARPLPYVIFGPPGTGKTITVVEAILQIFCLISESRILIATPSNSSANLIAEKLLDSRILQPGDLVRLLAYHCLESDAIPQKLLPYCVTADISEEDTNNDENRQDSRGCKTKVTLHTLCRHRIIVGTCSALGIMYNMGCKPGHFTHVFVDEAGLSSEPEIMIPLSLAHSSVTQVILAGDPKQLGPIVQSKLAGYFGLNDSFLVRLLQQFPYQKDPEGFETGYDPRLVTKLLMNYRSLPELLSLPNKLFYESELIPQIDPDDSEEADILESLSDILPQRMGAPPAIVFHCVNGTNMQDIDSPSWYNTEESRQIYMYLSELYNRGLKPEDIGIITPYLKQVYTIKTLLTQLEIEIPKIGSVENFQGQERKVILLSTVRTAEDQIKEGVRHSLGFVAARERLNVAITRSRALLIIVGCPRLLQGDVHWRSVIEHCIAHSSVVGRDSN